MEFPAWDEMYETVEPDNTAWLGQFPLSRFMSSSFVSANTLIML